MYYLWQLWCAFTLYHYSHSDPCTILWGTYSSLTHYSMTNSNIVFFLFLVEISRKLWMTSFCHAVPFATWILSIQMPPPKNWRCPTIFVLFAEKIWWTHRRNYPVDIFSIQPVCDRGSNANRHVQRAVWIYCVARPHRQIRQHKMMAWINWTITTRWMQRMRIQQPQMRTPKTITMATIFSMGVSWTNASNNSARLQFNAIFLFRSKSICKHFELTTQRQ